MSKGAAEKELEFWRDGKLGKGESANGKGRPAILLDGVRGVVLYMNQKFRVRATPPPQDF